MNEKHNNHEEFFPVGAVYFFVFMIVFYALLWFMVYMVLLERG